MNARIWGCIGMLLVLMVLGACQSIQFNPQSVPTALPPGAEQATLMAIREPQLIATYEAQRVAITNQIYLEESIYWRSSWPTIIVIIAIFFFLLAIVVYIYFAHVERDLREDVQLNERTARYYRQETERYQMNDSNDQRLH
jgi:uncharacterized membrane protein